MSQMPKFAEVQSKHRGFVQLVVAELEDENILVPFSIWETEEDYFSARGDVARFLATIDFSIQEGPTRAGGASISKGSNMTIFKVRSVQRPSGQPGP